MRDRTLTMTTTRRVLAALALLWGAPAAAQQATPAVAPDKDAPRLELFSLNQTYLEGVRARTRLPLADTRAMFSVVLASTRPRIISITASSPTAFVTPAISASMRRRATRARCISPIIPICRNGRAARI
jgi:hypothetical protein